MCITLSVIIAYYKLNLNNAEQPHSPCFVKRFFAGNLKKKHTVK